MIFEKGEIARILFFGRGHEKLWRQVFNGKRDILISLECDRTYEQVQENENILLLNIEK